MVRRTSERLPLIAPATALRMALALALALVTATTAISVAHAQSVIIDAGASGVRQMIDGFGTGLYGDEGQSDWFRKLYFDDLGCSILRVDIVPHFKAPYSDYDYNSPGSHQSPAFPGPEDNNVRTYTGASDYGRPYAGRRAAIAVMGPDIDKNVALFDFEHTVPKTAGALAKLGESKKAELTDFKLIGSMFSPSPWLKVSTGHRIDGLHGRKPRDGTPWPFIWSGNFAGGKLDTSGTPRAELDDTAMGGAGPTSALVQFARTLAAYLRGFQRTYGVAFYGISIQNELGFETFYNSCTYPSSREYIAALKAARAELDKYPDLARIRIMGPEDLLGETPYGLWELGDRQSTTHKSLQYLKNVADDAQAAKALDLFCIHGYAADGVRSVGAAPELWLLWAHGWTARPAAGLPAVVPGFASYGKRSWMTETAGENVAWLWPEGGFPGDGAFSIAVKIHQALTAGEESAWLYNQLTNGGHSRDDALTDESAQTAGPKYVAAKHFFRYVRPGAYRADTVVKGHGEVMASAFVHDANHTLTVVLVNAASLAAAATVEVPPRLSAIKVFDVKTSSQSGAFVGSTVDVHEGRAVVPLPPYGIATLVGVGAWSPLGPEDMALAARRDAPAVSTGSGGCGCKRFGVKHTGALLPLLVGLVLTAEGRRRRRRPRR